MDSELTVVDLTTCPSCGAVDRSASLEHLVGYADINVFMDEGVLSAQYGGSTDIEWESSTTQVYFCTLCRQELPEPYQKQLDQLLENQRQR